MREATRITLSLIYNIVAMTTTQRARCVQYVCARSLLIADYNRNYPADEEGKVAAVVARRRYYCSLYRSARRAKNFRRIKGTSK